MNKAPYSKESFDFSFIRVAFHAKVSKMVLVLMSVVCWASASADTTTPNRQNHALWASINNNPSTIYPSQDSEYRPSIGKILVSWRLLPGEDYATAFDLYRTPSGGKRSRVSPAAGIIGRTNFQDSYIDHDKDVTYELCYHGKRDVLSTYTITAEQLSAGVPYVKIPLQKWSGTPDGYIYKVNDCCYGDLDGDGETEIVVKRGYRPADMLRVNDGLVQEDSPAVRHSVIWEAYKLDGTLLWRVLSGPNIQTGNSSSFSVYDFDGDGKCEFVTRLSEGAVFGDGAQIGDTNGDGKTDYRTFSKSSHIHGAPEFLCVMDGATGKELARADFIPTGDDSELWGDDYWKRAASVRVGIIQCAADHPSILACRGIYAKSVVEAWDYQGGTLTRRWHFDSDNPGCGNYAAQGYHSLYVGDMDGDGLDEMCYGSMTLDHDGSPLYVSGAKNGVETVLRGAADDPDFHGYGHGDALRLGKFLPDRDGLQIWSCFETGDYGAALRAAATGETLWCIKNSNDVGRCCVADIFPEYPGCEMWWAGGKVMTATGEEILTDNGQPISPSATNVAIWFAGGINRQLLDGCKVCTKGAAAGNERRPLRADKFGAKPINGSKNNPCLYADLTGDWREEILYVDSLENNLMLFSTWYPTDYAFHTLTSDHLYEMSAINQNIGYNQGTELSFYLGSDMLSTVSFVEANGSDVTVTPYHDANCLAAAENGKLVLGRTYYYKAVDKQGNVFKSSFTPVERQQTVRFDMKASTDISSPETSAASHSLPAYDLMGRRLLQPAAGQLYIVKGKKFFVK